MTKPLNKYVPPDQLLPAVHLQSSEKSDTCVVITNKVDLQVLSHGYINLRLNYHVLNKVKGAH